jgi:hypothetical protein
MPVPKGYCVHHIDHDMYNNDPSNLQLMTMSDHIRHHHLGKKLSEEAKKNIGRSKAGTHPKMPPCTEEKRRKLIKAASSPERLKKFKFTIGKKRLRRYLDK